MSHHNTTPSQAAEAVALSAIKASRAAGDFTNTAAHEAALSSFAGGMFTFDEAKALATFAVRNAVEAFRAQQEANQFLVL